MGSSPFSFLSRLSRISLVRLETDLGLSAAQPTGVWILYFLVTLLLAIVYFTFQIFLVFTTLDEQWPIGASTYLIVVDVLLAGFFFLLAQIGLFALSTPLCTLCQHYLDGLFFSTILNLLAVMMVYKFWDSITKEDLEFAVGIKG